MRGARLAAALAVVLLALLHRVPALDAPALWFDEAYSFCLAHEPAGAILRYVREDAHPPLYFLALHAWLAGAGGVVAARALSVACDLATIALVLLLAPPAWRLRAGLLLALASTMVLQARQVRMYAMLSLEMTAALFALERAMESGRPAHWLGFAVCALVAPLTHHVGGLAMLALTAPLLLESLRSPAPRAAALRSRFLLAGGLALLAYALLWLEPALYQLRSTPLAARGQVSYLAVFIDLTAGTLPAWPAARAVCVIAFGAALAASAIALIRSRAGGFELRLWAFAIAGFLVTPSLPGGAFPNRALFYLQPAVLMLVAHGLTTLGAMRLPLTGACLALLAASTANALLAPPPPYDWAACARTLDREAGERPLVVVYNANSRLLLEAYLVHAWGRDVELTSIPYVSAETRFAGLGVDQWRPPTVSDLDRVEKLLATGGRTRWFLVLSSPESAEASQLLARIEARWGPSRPVGSATSPAIRELGARRPGPR